MNWAIFSGSLPAGLSLSNDGTITGTPTTPTSQAANFTVNATIGEGASSVFSAQTLTISVTKSDAELGGLNVSGNTGFQGHFQYGDIITVTFTPQLRVTTSTKSLAENTATLTYTNAEGKTVTLATATAQADGSFKLTYDTKEKKLPIGEDLSLTVSYGGSSGFNPVEETVTLSLDQAILKNMPTVTGSFVYGGTLTLNYTPQDDETVSYQWWRIIDDSNTERIDGATGETYTLTESEIGESIYVIVSATDEWHRGAKQSDQYEICKASLDEDAIEITNGKQEVEFDGTSTTMTLTATVTVSDGLGSDGKWRWTSSHTDMATVPEDGDNANTQMTTRAGDETTSRTSQATVTFLSTGTVTITAHYNDSKYEGDVNFTITVKAKEEEPAPDPKPDPTPLYYNIQFEEVCEGVDASLSKSVVKAGNQVSVYIKSVVKAGNQVSVYIEVEEGYNAENLKVLCKRSLYGYWEEVEEGVQPGEYIIYNVYNDIYVKVEGVEKIEEEPTGMSDIESTKVYTQNGNLYIYTSQPQEVMIITMSGTVLRRERQEGLRSYSLPRGVYIICIGAEKFKLRI